MALPILDGNQSATTLSTILSSGQHITAHTVVSLGTQAITDIASAVSGTSVCVGAISISGTPSVTGSVSVLNFPASQSTTFGAVTGSVSVLNFPASQAVTFSAVSISNFPSTQTIAGTVTANLANVVTTDLYSVASAVKVTGADGQGVLLGGLNSIGNPENVYEGGAIPVRGSVGMDVPISGTVTVGNSVTISSLPSLVAGTAQIGVVTIGNIRRAGDNAISQLSTEAGSNYLLTVVMPGTSQIGSVTASISNSVTIASFATSVTARLINPAGTAVTYAEVGTAGNPSIDVLSVQGVTSGTPLTILNHQGTTVTTSNFTSTTASTTLASANTSREVLTIFNEGAGNLHICAGATCTTIAYQVRLSAGDYYEVPLNQTSLTHSAVFATAGTARIVQIS